MRADGNVREVPPRVGSIDATFRETFNVPFEKTHPHACTYRSAGLVRQVPSPHIRKKGPMNRALRWPSWSGLFIFLAFAIFALWEDRQTHFLGALPYILLLLCSISYVLIHRSHGGGAAKGGRRQ